MQAETLKLEAEKVKLEQLKLQLEVSRQHIQQPATVLLQAKEGAIDKILPDFLTAPAA